MTAFFSIIKVAHIRKFVTRLAFQITTLVPA